MFSVRPEDKRAGLSKPAEASVAFTLCRFFQAAAAALSTAVFTRLMSTEEFGRFTVINSWLPIIMVLTTFGMSGGVFRQSLVKFEDRKDELAASASGVITVTILLFYGAYLLMRRQINEAMDLDTLIVTGLFLMSWAKVIFDFWANRKRNEYDHRPEVLLTMIMTSAELIVGAVAVICTDRYKAEARFLSIAVLSFAVYVRLFTGFLKKGRFYDKEKWEYYLKLSIPLMPCYLISTVMTQSDRLMIKELTGVSEAGIYGLGHNLAWMLCLFTGAIIYSLHPWIFKRIKAGELKTIGGTVYAVLTAVAFIGLGLVAVTPEALRIFAPEDYHAAKWVIPPLAVSTYFLFMIELFTCFAFYFERSLALTVISITEGLANIVLNYLCIRSFGWIAAGYTTFFCTLCYAAVHYLYMRHIIKKELDDARVLSLTVMSCITAAYMILAAAMMALYDHVIMRYGFILLGLIVIFLMRGRLMRIVDAIRQDRK